MSSCAGSTAYDDPDKIASRPQNCHEMALTETERPKRASWHFQRLREKARSEEDRKSSKRVMQNVGRVGDYFLQVKFEIGIPGGPPFRFG